ncbi:transcriptional regulator, partial [Cichlidogyrus casuarinus]
MGQIGDHIRSLLRELSKNEERNKWKYYLWRFVKIFSAKSVEELQSVYKKYRERSASENSESGGRKHKKHKKHHRSPSPRHREDSQNGQVSGLAPPVKEEDRFDNAFNRVPGGWSDRSSYQHKHHHGNNARKHTRDRSEYRDRGSNHSRNFHHRNNNNRWDQAQNIGQPPPLVPIHQSTVPCRDP